MNWAVELESPLDLERSGWSRDSVKPGDAVTVQGILARDGSQQVWGNSVVLTSTRRKVLAMSPEASAALEANRKRPAIQSRRHDGPTAILVWVRSPAKRDTGPDQARRY